MVGGEKFRWHCIIMCQSSSLCLSNACWVCSTFGVSKCISLPAASHVCCISPLLIQSLYISVFLTSLSCLDTHCWARLCYITDRWITWGNACSTAGHCRFPWSHKYTNKQTYIQRFSLYIAPESTYTVRDECHPSRHSAQQSIHHMQNVLLELCYYVWGMPLG